MQYGAIYQNQAEQFAKEEKVLWACAYAINDDSDRIRRIQLPVKGMIIKDKSTSMYERYQYKFAQMDSKGRLKKSGRVNYDARLYADTYEESIELFNKNVAERQHKLEQMLSDTKQDYIDNDTSSVMHISV